MNADLLKEFVRLTAQKRDAEAQLKDLKARLDELEPQVSDGFIDDGVQSVNIDGYTVYLNRKLFAGPKDGDKTAMIEALSGLDEDWSFLVQDTVNHNQLQARVRECELDDQGMPILPPELAETMTVYEQFRVGARKSD